MKNEVYTPVLTKKINRTISIILEPGKTKALPISMKQNTNENPDFFHYFQTQYDKICSSYNTSGDSCNIMVLHSMYDYKIASENLVESFKERGNKVCDIDCTKTEITTLFSKSSLINAALNIRLIDKIPVQAQTLIRNISPLGIFLLPFLLDLALASLPDSIKSLLWIVATIFVLICSIILFVTNSIEKNIKLFTVLEDKLKKLILNIKKVCRRTF